MATGNMYRKFRDVLTCGFWYASGQTDRQTYKHAYLNTSLPTGGKWQEKRSNAITALANITVISTPMVERTDKQYSTTFSDSYQTLIREQTTSAGAIMTLMLCNFVTKLSIKIIRTSKMCTLFRQFSLCMLHNLIAVSGTEHTPIRSKIIINCHKELADIYQNTRNICCVSKIDPNILITSVWQWKLIYRNPIPMAAKGMRNLPHHAIYAPKNPHCPS